MAGPTIAAVTAITITGKTTSTNNHIGPTTLQATFAAEQR